MQHASELLFAGKIPTEFSIVESDVTSVKIPLPYYALLSRMSYFPLETLEVVNHFKGSVIELEQAIWFECEGKPLKSHLPIGVLFDLHSKNMAIPWKIVIHFRHFPGNKLIRSSTPNDAEKLFSHSLKQSVFLLSGNTRLFTSLSILKQTDLHQSIAAGDCQLYGEIIGGITSAVSVSSARSIPVAIIVSDGRPVMQRPVSAYTAAPVGSGDTADSTASIEEVQLDTVQSASEEDEKEGKEDKEDQGTEKDDSSTPDIDTISIDTGSKGRLTTLQDVLSDAFRGSDISMSNDDIGEIFVQGISLPREASIYDIWERFRHLDLFLYITVHVVPAHPSPSHREEATEIVSVT